MMSWRVALFSELHAQTSNYTINFASSVASWGFWQAADSDHDLAE